MEEPSFGQWLRKTRTDLGLTQPYIQAETGIGVTHLSAMENGRIGLPKKETRDRLHKVLGTSDEDLVSAGILRKAPATEDGDALYLPASGPPGTIVGHRIGRPDDQGNIVFREHPVAYDATDDRQAIAELVKHISDHEARKLRLVLEVFVDYGQ